MKPSRNLSCYVVAAFTLLSFAVVEAQTFPSFVVDAQVPIASSDGFSSPQGLAAAPGGIVYVADSGNHRLLKFSLGGAQTTVSLGAFAPVPQTMNGLATDAVGDLFVADTATNRLIKLPAGGGHAVVIMGAPLLDRPTAVASDAAGDVAVVNSGNATVVVRRYGPASVFNTGSTVLVAPTAVAFDNEGRVYVADAGNGTIPPEVYRFPSAGGTGAAIALFGYELKNVTGLVLDDQRNLFVLDGGSQQLIEVPASGAAPYLIPQSNFKSPSGLALDNLGNIYVSDSGASSNTVTKLVYNNAANFGSAQVGATSHAITFNYEFYERTIVEAIRGIGGGVWNADYHKAAGGTCALRTYFPTTSSTGLILPASCTANFDFLPLYVGGRPGAVQLQTSNGNATQLTIGTGLGAQLAVMNASTTTKVASVGSIFSLVVNAGETEIYYSTGGGTYKVPVTGGTPALVTTIGGYLAVNGAGDLFIYDGASIHRIPADGSTASVIAGPKVASAGGMAMDSNGAFYISDAGPGDPNADFYTPAGAIWRVSPTGYVSSITRTSDQDMPTLITSDTQGNIFVEDNRWGQIFEIAAWTGDFTLGGSAGPNIGGLGGAFPLSFTVDANGTVYYWDRGDFGEGLFYAPVNNRPLGNSNGGIFLPYFTVSEFQTDQGFEPFYAEFGASIVNSPSGKMYAFNGSDPGVYLINRTLGSIPEQGFDPKNVAYTFLRPGINLFNIGNQNLTFSSSPQLFTESGNGVGAFTFEEGSCPGATLLPSTFCAMGVTEVNPVGKGPLVEDTLHFLTNAANDNSVSFRIYGTGSPAP